MFGRNLNTYINTYIDIFYSNSSADSSSLMQATGSEFAKQSFTQSLKPNQFVDPVSIVT